MTRDKDRVLDAENRKLLRFVFIAAGVVVMYFGADAIIAEPAEHATIWLFLKGAVGAGLGIGVYHVLIARHYHDDDV